MESIAKFLGERITHLRKTNGLTQKELASLAGVAENTLGNLEMGERMPHAETLDKILAALEVGPASLFDSDQRSELLVKLVGIIFDLNDNQLRIVVEFTEDLAALGAPTTLTIDD